MVKRAFGAAKHAFLAVTLSLWLWLCYFDMSCVPGCSRIVTWHVTILEHSGMLDMPQQHSQCNSARTTAQEYISCHMKHSGMHAMSHVPELSCVNPRVHVPTTEEFQVPLL